MPSSSAVSGCVQRGRCPRGSSRARRGDWRGFRAGARRLLLLAAAEPVGPAPVRVAQQVGIPQTAALAAESEGLLMLHGAVVFRIRACARRFMGLPRRASGAEFTACGRTQRIRRSTRIAARGIARRIRPDEEVAGRAGALGGAGGGAWRLRRCCRLPRARRRLDARHRRRAPRVRVAAQTLVLAGALDDVVGLLASRRSVGSTSSIVPESNCSARGSHSAPRTAATRPRCCWRLPAGSRRCVRRSPLRRCSRRPARRLRGRPIEAISRALFSRTFVR